ncbi:hypothetical protein B0H14DRAFT_2397988 [Mycena olivaceomarginata]|nr:hypothetical protein B0H14DRAFT_2397988 [Mycena olivaceomarginata]
MLVAARTFCLTLDALALSKDLKEELPIFFHVGLKKGRTKHNNSECARCLRDNHNMRTTGDTLAIVERNYFRHSRRKNCACGSCREDRGRGCISPYLCQEEAIKFLDGLAEKWDPRRKINQPCAELTEEEIDANKAAMDKDEPVIFDPKIIVHKLSEVFRIFGEITCESAADQLDPLEDEMDVSENMIYIGNHHSINEDGECISTGSIWYGENDDQNSPINVGQDFASEESGGIAAILHAIRNSPRQNILHFKVGSSRLIKALTTGIPGNEDSGWLGVENSVLLKTIVAVLHGRGSRCTFQKVDDLDPNMGKAKELARDAPGIGQPVQLQTVIPPAFCLEGMKLSEGSQRTFYRHLKNRRKTPLKGLKRTAVWKKTH